MFTLKTYNRLLAFAVVLLGTYIAIAPLLPQIEYKLRNTSPEYIAPYEGDLANTQGSTSTDPLPTDNRLVIPSIGVNEPIIESTSINSIRNGGTWRRPNTARPNEQSNTVIVGHRYFRSSTSTFYHLDKVAVGERLAVYWEGTEILYEVNEIKVVPANAVAIEAPTTKEQLTLYTCTPIWTATERLVVIAKPVTIVREI
jgi:LPXTG-site transpeptidase (sortase) family protein